MLARALRRRGAGSLTLGGGILCYRPYRCADGYVALGALEPKFFGRVLRRRGAHRISPSTSSILRAPMPTPSS